MNLVSLNISKKMSLAIALVSITALSIVAIFTFNIVSLTIEEQTKSQLVSESNMRGEIVRTLLESKIQHIEDFSKNQDLKKSINDINQITNSSLTQVAIEEKHTEFLDNISELRDGSEESLKLDNLQILDHDGQVIFSLEDTPIKFLQNYESVVNGQKATVKFTPATNSTTGNLVIAVPVFVSEEITNSEPMGAIIAVLDIKEIDQILLDKFRVINKGESFLVNEEHMIISDSISSDDKFAKPTDIIPIQKCFDEGENFYGKYPNRNDIQVYGFSFCAKDLGFALITEIDQSDILNPIMNLQQGFLVVGVVIVSGIVFASFFFSKSISRPIMRLRDAANEISNGNFHARTKIKSGDEIEQLSISFDIMAEKIQDALQKIKQKDLVIKEQQDLLEFSEHRQKYCIGIIDIVSSTKITAKLSDDDTRSFYGIFINFMGSIINEFGGVVIKNIGDALLFYFPDMHHNDARYFENVVNCCMKMIDSHGKINDEMDVKGLSSCSYRISAVYGPVMIAQMSTSTVADIFGSTVNICTKINSLAQANGFVIDGDLYNHVKLSSRFKFKEIENYYLDDHTKISVYSVKYHSRAKKLQE